MHDYHPPLHRLVFLFPALLNLMNTLLVNLSYFNVLIAFLNLNLLILLLQFVLFYACSLDPENCGRRFADTLFHKFKSSKYPEWR